jgi:hypothetical protein
MKKVWNLLLFAFFVFCLFLFKPRQDVLFGAVSESHYIRLFEKGMDFELGVEDHNTFTGTYTILKDTVYLSYREQPLLSAGRRILPSKLFINNGGATIKARDGKAFSARIYLDIRKKNYRFPAYSIGVLKNQNTPITGVGSDR